MADQTLQRGVAEAPDMKPGKNRLTYAQHASQELVAALARAAKLAVG
jgi:hypothetical protein